MELTMKTYGLQTVLSLIKSFKFTRSASIKRLKTPVCVLVSCLLCLVALESKALVSFPEWVQQQSDKYIEDLKNQSAGLSSQEIALSVQRIKEAKESEQWASVVSEYGRVLGKDPNNMDHFKDWLQLILANQKLREVDKNNWKAFEDARSAAIHVYRLAKTPEQKAEVLLVLGNMLDPENPYDTPNYAMVLNEVHSLVSVEKLKKEHPYLKNFMPHQFVKTEVNNQGSPPSVCFNFSQPLKSPSAGFHYEDYIQITPKVDGNLKVSGRQLCLSPVQFGATYDVILKKGIPNEYNDKTEEDQHISFKVKDQDARLSFSPNAYVLMREDNPVLPLTGVNVDTVTLKILRINDRALNDVVKSNSDISFLSSLWPYRVEQLENYQGELLFSGEFDLKTENNQTTEKNKTVTKQIPLQQVIKNIKPGIYIVYAEEANAVWSERSRATQWLIISDMGLTTFTEDSSAIFANIRSLKSASPLSEVEVKLVARNNALLGTAKTNQEGNVYFESNLTRGTGGNQPTWILAYGKKGDFSLLNLEQSSFDFSDRSVGGRESMGPLEAFLFTEQGVYRPQDTVHVTTLLRNLQSKSVGDLPLTFKLLRPDDVEVLRKTITGNKLGYYELTLPLQAATRTGQWKVLAYTDVKKDPIGQVNFSVEDFVPSRVLINVTANKPALTLEEAIKAEVKAQYLFGAKAAGLTGQAVLSLRKMPNPYPEYPGFTFGLSNETFLDKRENLVFSGLNSEGIGEIPVSLEGKAIKTSLPLEANIRVTLSDKGGRPETGSLKLPVYLKPFMIGLKPHFSENQLPRENHEASFDVIAVTPQKKLTNVKNLEYELYEERYNYTWYQPQQYQAWQYKKQTEDKFLSKGQFEVQSDGPNTLKIPLKEEGNYRLEIRDPKNDVATSIQFSKGWREITVGEDSPEKLKVKIDKEQLKPGETATLKIESPFEGQALVTLANDKIIENYNIKVSKQGTEFKITAKESFGSGIYCLVSAFRPLSSNNPSSVNPASVNPDKDNGKNMDKSFLPKRAVGIAWIAMNTEARELDIQWSVPEGTRPNQMVEIPITVRSKDSQPLKEAMVTVSAVDEGILKLTDFQTPDPKTFFLGQRQLGIMMRDLYGKLIDPISGKIGILRSGGDQALLSRNMQALSKRSFKVVSLYEGLVPLDSGGKGKITLSLPNFNGTLRMMAVAFDETRVGSQSAELLVRNPIVIEGSLPRFLAPNDQTFLNVSFHNITGESNEYQITTTATGAVILSQNPTQTLNLQKGASQSLSIPLQAKTLGNGKITLRLQGKGLDLNQEFDISVRAPTPEKTENGIQLLKTGDSMTLHQDVMKGAIMGTERVMAQFSTHIPWDTSLLYRFLKGYPYGCVEQIVSRALGILLYQKSETLQDKNLINNALALISEKQNADGSFSLWSNPQASDPWLTAYVMDFLLLAQSKHYEVPTFTLKNGVEWLKKYMDSKREDEQSLNNATYALYILTKANRLESGSLRYFYDTYYESLSNPFSRAMIANSLISKGDIERAKKAFQNLFEKNNPVTLPFGSNIRDKAGILSLLLQSTQKEPTLNVSDMISSITGELTESLKKNVNVSTQEAAWILWASYNMQDRQEKTIETPLEILINDKKEIALKERPQALTLDLTTPLKESTALKITNPNPYSVWGSWAVSYIPEKMEAAKNGLEIKREYYTLEGKAVTLENVKQGEEFIVKISGKVETPLAHSLLIVDLLPAGFEIQNANLDPSNALSTVAWLNNLTPPVHTELRDDRYLAFLNLTETQSEFAVAYLLRAVSLGSYVNPGAFVEDMYAPKYFANTKSEQVQVSAP